MTYSYFFSNIFIFKSPVNHFIVTNKLAPVKRYMIHGIDLSGFVAETQKSNKFTRRQCGKSLLLNTTSVRS